MDKSPRALIVALVLCMLACERKRAAVLLPVSDLGIQVTLPPGWLHQEIPGSGSTSIYNLDSIESDAPTISLRKDGKASETVARKSFAMEVEIPGGDQVISPLTTTTVAGKKAWVYTVERTRLNAAFHFPKPSRPVRVMERNLFVPELKLHIRMILPVELAGKHLRDMDGIIASVRPLGAR